MSEPLRKQPPSPLVFSPETVPAVSHPPKYGSGSNTVSMPFIKRHVTRRLKAAKQECDKELQRVTHAITTFFEQRLREVDQERERDRESREFRGRSQSQSLHRDHERDSHRDHLLFQPAQLRTTAHVDDASSDGGYEAEFESTRHSRQPSVSSSPSSLRRQNTLPKERVSMASAAPVPLPSSNDPALRRPPSSGNLPSAWAASGPNRRLSRTIHIPVRATPSSQSSRSNSRSRSPLPPATHAHNSFSESVSTSPNRRASRILVDDPVDPIMSTLYEIIAVATDITEMSIAQLTAETGICFNLVQRVQNIGKAWDEHPDWHGRNWYVQVLLAVASLSRVVEWWEAEKQFWNFEDDDDEQAEPFTFLLKPAYDAIQGASTPSVDMANKESKPTVDEENRLKLHRPPSLGRRSRDDSKKDQTVAQAHGDGDHQRTHYRVLDKTESARVLATERLRLQSEKAQNLNIVMELSLDGDHFIWVNHAWSGVIGTEPDDMVGTRISRILAPPDHKAFKDATEHLLSDDTRTVEVRFRLQVEPEGELNPAVVVYREMEGKGMLMLDHVDGQPSHTMWVMKPVGPPELAPLVEEPIPKESEPNAQLLSRTISTAVILCRICENNIPEWFFEKHNETCNEVHKLEAEIGESNESLTVLRNSIHELRTALDRSSPATPPEYRGIPVMSATPSGSSSPMQLFRPPLVSKMQRMGVRRMQKKLLEQLDETLQAALDIGMPSLKEEESKEPIERQRLLSPTSERKVLQVRKWSKPTPDDAALSRLVADAELLMRAKLDSVGRMQNTIRYSEKVRQEWEEKIEKTILSLENAQSDDEDDDDHSSTKSEYAYDGGAQTSTHTPSGSADPTPMASSSPVPSSRGSSGRGTPYVPPMTLIPVVSGAIHGPILHPLTRSSTPSSISSPLALVAPIVASPEPESILMPSTLIENPVKQLLKRSSNQNLEPRVTVTPPLSPSGHSKTEPINISRARRPSNVSTIFSPTISASAPLSPRIPSVAPSSRAPPTSIKDFEIIKPISKGAFGSVFLAKKRVTGDYYAIKVLKKADMIAKNQITNVKAERMILMNQAESPFVVKLYYTFQSKDNLYLVMEYLNGGDCAALIKSIGSLPEEWTKNYIAEVVLGLEYLHQRGVVHRDLKPDNLLIDQHGHLKLTDFGLSRIGLLGRQTREPQLSHDRTRPRTRYSPHSRPPSMDLAYLTSPLSVDLTTGGSYFNLRTSSTSQPLSTPYLPSGPPTDDISESSGSESLSGLFHRRKQPGESPLQSFATELTNDLRSHSTSGAGTPPGEQKFVGTPDYLAPESILGIAGDDETVDWWALGVITYEFLYGFPPFHAESPEKVFENILSGHIDWHEEWVDFSPEAHDFMKRLMTIDTGMRLGSKGAEEVKAHPFFSGIEWDKVTTSEAAFIPQVTDPESTDYFDLRGATPQLFHEDDTIPVSQPATLRGEKPSSSPFPVSRELHSNASADDFGSFSFKNLPVLKQANDEMIKKLRTDQMNPLVQALAEPPLFPRPHRRSVSQRVKKPPSVVTTSDNKISITNPPSPATSASSIASSPSRSSAQVSTPGSIAGGHVRRPSEFGAVERFKMNQLEVDPNRRNSMPSRLRTSSISSIGDACSSSDHWPPPFLGGALGQHDTTPPSSVASSDVRRNTDTTDRAVTCLLAEDNPITAKILETLLTRLGCRCVVVADGSEAISVAMGDIQFDCILMDLHMPVVDGESASRFIRSTANKNSNVPIISVSAYSAQDAHNCDGLFSAMLAKPVQKADLLTTMRQLGFKTSTHQDGGVPLTKVIATR